MIEKNEINILFIGFNSKDQNDFIQALENDFKDNIYSSCKNIKDAKKFLKKDSIIFLKYEAKTIEGIKLLSKNPIVLFTDKELPIKSLRPFFNFNVIDILTQAPSKKRALSLITKVSINLLFHQNIPFGALEHITKSSIKVKNYEQLQDYIFKYFSYFEEVSIKSFLIKENEHFNYLYGTKDSELESLINLNDLHERYIGSYLENENLIAIPVNKDDTKVTWVCIETKLHAQDVLVDLLFIHLNRIELYRNLKTSVGSLIELSMTDEVTGLFNQRRLTQDLEAEIMLCNEQDLHFSLLFVDIDHFKKVNDSHGHVVGSSMLKQLGEVLTRQVRSTDTVYRYGGDEFIVLMRKTKVETVYSVATRMLNKISQTNFAIDNEKNYNLGVSIGIAEFPKDASTPKEIVEFADKMMYKSKDSGRGKVFHVKEVS